MYSIRDDDDDASIPLIYDWRSKKRKKASTETQKLSKSFLQ